MAGPVHFFDFSAAPGVECELAVRLGVLGLLLFAILFWIESPPPFLVHGGWPTFAFALALWLGELLAYAIGIAGIVVLLVFLGSHIFYLLGNARRWYRLQEIRSWRAKRPCNERK